MLVLTIVVVVIVGGVIGYQFLYLPARTSPPTINLNSSAYVGSHSGLRLYLTLDSPFIKNGSNIVVRVYENNTLDRPNNVSVSDNWATTNHSFSGCYNYLPIGLAVLRGNHTVGDLPKSVAADQLQGEKPGDVYACGPIPDFRSYEFRPLSYSARICDPKLYAANGPWCQDREVSRLLLVGGYWTGDGNRTPAIYHWFEPGIYTVTGEDEWGRVALLHFVVSAR